MTYEITLYCTIKYDEKPFLSKHEKRTVTKARAAKAVYKRLTREIIDTFDLEANNGASYLFGSVDIFSCDGVKREQISSFHDIRELSFFDAEGANDEE